MSDARGSMREPEEVLTDERIQVAAAIWHSRMSEPSAPEFRAAFSRWLDESPRHVDAYQRLDEMSRTVRDAAHDPRILALRHEAALRLMRAPTRRWHLRAWVAAAVVVAFVSLGVNFQHVLLTGAWPAFAGSHSTDIGERLMVVLDDGTRVTLNTNSGLRSRFTEAERRVVLERGQALFEVSKDPVRPFVVEAQGRRFVALGTAFDVRVDGSQVQVTMLEGVVRVEPAAGGHAHAETLTAGEQLVSDAARGERVRIADPERVTSWRRGQVVFDDTRLADAITELNRYSERRMELADATLQELRISGAFTTGPPDVFIEALTSYFPVHVERSGDRRIVLGMGKAPPVVQ